MSVCQLRHHAATRRALDEALHDEERFIDFLDGACVLADGGGYGGKSYRTAAELVYYGEQNLVVYLVKTILVDVQSGQSDARYLCVYASGALHLSEVSYSSEQRIG